MDLSTDLTALLTLEPIEVNLFRGVSPPDSGPRIFGGQVIAQALWAAYATVPERICHSLHAYFIRPGDSKAPVLYQVDRARDGGTFTTRRVTAIQHGEQIFNLAASFQAPEEGLDFQVPMPSAPDPETVPDEHTRMAAYGDALPKAWLAHLDLPRPIDIRWVDPQDLLAPAPMAPRKQVWLRASGKIGDDIRQHQVQLAYASDLSFLETALRVHGLTWYDKALQSASLDHAIWFHRPFNFNDWMLFAQDCPSTSQARGLVRGEMFGRDGALVASMTQECLMRIRKPA
jgi:acyl-CoA thioesterase-2